MLLQEWSRLDRSQLTRLVEVVQQFITLHLYEAQTVDHEASRLLICGSLGNHTPPLFPGWFGICVASALTLRPQLFAD
jgi:hypothetical protein